jgi:hypothetical protein
VRDRVDDLGGQVVHGAPERLPQLGVGGDEVDHYLRRVEAERQSQTMPTDQEADEARVKAPDIV